MIRVTYNNKSVEVKNEEELKDLQIALLLSNVKDYKIEKQVKDLTLEECFKLNFFKGGKIYSENYHEYDMYFEIPGLMGDYIDVTKLYNEVKG